MKTDIILAGVGGQGILTIAAALGWASLEENLYVKQAEVHGMSQRGGAVQSHMRISSEPIASDLIPKGQADLILAVEPMESLRYLPWMAASGWLVTNSAPYENIPDYPDLSKIRETVDQLPKHRWIDADQIARELKSPRSSNMVILGAGSPYIGMKVESFHQGIRKIFSNKGEEVVNTNILAFNTGRELSLGG